MTLFELVRVTLENLYAACQVQYREGTDEAIRARISYLAAKYEALSKQDNSAIDYQDPATRFAYVFKYVAAHGDFVHQLLSELASSQGNALFAPGHVQVACIGGGPGSDVIGFLKYLENSREAITSVDCYMLDKEQAWQDSWAGVNRKLNAGGAFSSYYQILDVTKMGSWANQRNFLNSELFTLSYFISEVMKFDLDGSVSAFLEALFAGAKPGAYFLYDDNKGYGGFTKFFDAACAKGGLSLIRAQDGMRLTPSPWEEKSELSAYTAKFGQSPKLTGNVDYRVYRKL